MARRSARTENFNKLLWDGHPHRKYINCGEIDVLTINALFARDAVAGSISPTQLTSSATSVAISTPSR
jgi:hypothetical protein